MGNVFAELTLKNGSDLTRLNDGHISDKDVRSVTVTAVVDTGALTLVINEAVCQKLGLAIEGIRTATLAGGNKIECKITEPVKIYWKDRDVSCQAAVLPEGEILLGVIPLEFMDVIVDPVAEQLVGAHGDRIISRVLRNKFTPEDLTQRRCLQANKVAKERKGFFRRFLRKGAKAQRREGLKRFTTEFHRVLHGVTRSGCS